MNNRRINSKSSHEETADMETVSGRGRMTGFDRWPYLPGFLLGCPICWDTLHTLGICPILDACFFLTPKTDFSIRHDRR